MLKCNVHNYSEIITIQLTSYQNFVNNQLRNYLVNWFQFTAYIHTNGSILDVYVYSMYMNILYTYVPYSQKFSNAINLNQR